MRIVFINSLTFLLFILMTQNAHALLEVRVGYGLNFSSPGDLNKVIPSDAVKVGNMYGFNIDVLSGIPTVPVGCGLRYESFTISNKSDTSLGEFNYVTGYSRLALLVNYRVLDNAIYLGPMASFGLSNSATYSFSVAGGPKNTYNTTNGSSISIAVEAGGKFGTFMAGAEVGYLFANYGTPSKDSSDLQFQSQNIVLDFTGLYAKVLVGVTF